MLSTLTEHTHLDFSVDNARAVLIWVIKNANTYLDDQLIDLVERMTEQASITNYKSNQRTWGNDDWKYCRKPEDLSNYSLEYRMVLEKVGGIHVGYYSSDSRNGLSEAPANLLNDILTVANNIGFDTTNMQRASSFEWESNKQCIFEYKDHVTDEVHQLMAVRAFKNGNLHIKFNQAFIMKLNVEFGRLKGWLKSAKEAADELDISVEEAMSSFNSNLKLDQNSFLQLMSPAH